MPKDTYRLGVSMGISFQDLRQVPVMKRQATSHLGNSFYGKLGLIFNNI